MLMVALLAVDALSQVEEVFLRLLMEEDFLRLLTEEDFRHRRRRRRLRHQAVDGRILPIAVAAPAVQSDIHFQIIIGNESHLKTLSVTWGHRCWLRVSIAILWLTS